MDLSNARVALVHDYLADYGGAERVLEAIHELFPDAPVYVAFIDRQRLGRHAERFADWDIRQSWLRFIPGHRKLFSPLRIFAPSFFRRFDLSDYDLVISSSNAYFAKAVRVPNGVHVCYCHTPPRALWGYSTQTRWKERRLTRIGGTLINHFLRPLDVQYSRAIDHLIANSKETQARIKKFYRRESQVIYPPASLAESSSQTVSSSADRRSDQAPFLFISRLAWSKHPELAVAACNALELPLVVAGEGALYEELRRLAGPTVQVVGGVSDVRLTGLYAAARALIYPVEDEDFGIVPVEAMQHGLPVIAHASGGPLETVRDGVTGVQFTELTEAGVRAAIQSFISQEASFDSATIRAHAEQFSKTSFQNAIRAYLAALE